MHMRKKSHANHPVLAFLPTLVTEVAISAFGQGQRVREKEAHWKRLNPTFVFLGPYFPLWCILQFLQYYYWWGEGKIRKKPPPPPTYPIQHKRRNCDQSSSAALSDTCGIMVNWMANSYCQCQDFGVEQYYTTIFIQRLLWSMEAFHLVVHL